MYSTLAPSETKIKIGMDGRNPLIHRQGFILLLCPAIWCILFCHASYIIYVSTEKRLEEKKYNTYNSNNNNILTYKLNCRHKSLLILQGY